MLQALAFASESLLLGHWRERASSVLQHLGEATEMSRVYIFRNRVGAGRVLTTQIAEWTAAGIEPQMGNPELVDFALSEGGYGRWIEVLGREEIVDGSVGEFPSGEQAFLAAQNILAVAVAPIHVGGRWWGFIRFDDCVSSRAWSREEREHAETEQRLRHAVEGAHRDVGLLSAHRAGRPLRALP